MKKILVLSAIFFVSCFSVSAQQKKEMFPSARIDNSLDSAVVNYKKQQRSITYGSVTVEGKSINYEAATGSLVFKNAQDTPLISMSYTAYFKSGDDPTQRPLTFIYNGGPGSSTIWLHMGAWGPQRVYLADTSRKRPMKL